MFILDFSSLFSSSQ